MTDRELLKQAAKAAGYNVEWVPENKYFIILKHHWSPWQPLHNDGDALRLAVKLRMELDLGHDGMSTAFAPGSVQGHSHDHDDDPYAATRRAIVRAAAEIGKEIK